jgi:2Fe-2S ferredoxin
MGSTERGRSPRRDHLLERGQGMPGVTFIDPNGVSHAVSGEDGMSLMEVAVRHGVDGIEADCGGACACATCHVYVDPEWFAVTGPAGGDEAEMLEFAIDPEPTSRLSCQVRLTAAMDGMVIRVPASQH